ncbi:MAG: hypothetical protein WD358_01880 [Nitriliruptoraceae bacterium]
MSPSWPQPTRADHKQFVVNEGWKQVPSTHHETYELDLPDGRVLRTRISRPPNKTTYGARMWAHILADQLDVTADDFWACVRDNIAPSRAPDDVVEEVNDAIPVDVVNLLIGRVDLAHRDIVGMTRDEAIARLNEYWSTGQ